LTSENMLFHFSFPFNFRQLQRALAVPFALALLATSAMAQSTSQALTLKQALDAAWQLSSQSRSLDNRRGELAAKEKAATSWISGEPALGVSHRTDQLNRDGGFREYEAGIELPLWNPGVRTAAQADVSAQRQGFDAQLLLSKLKLAGELRALAASAATAQVELDLNKRKLLDANALTQDVMRRVKAGENARVDGLQAQMLAQQAQTAMTQASSQLTRLQNQWRSLTGLTTVATLDETLTSSAANETLAAPVSPDHPALRYAQAQVSSAQAKLALADADKRDPMALGVGVARERTNFAGANDTKLRIALRIPLGGDNRNEPRRAVARAALDYAQAEADAVLRQLPNEVATASTELGAARATQAAATERVRLSTQVQALITKSWRMGNSDLPARLRGDNEQFEASLSLARATVEVQRAIANLNQAHGFLP
jgi:cobalt-zinc-cadmium efflux system outer membrane protein